MSWGHQSPSGSPGLQKWLTWALGTTVPALGPSSRWRNSSIPRAQLRLRRPSTGGGAQSGKVAGEGS